MDDVVRRTSSTCSTESVRTLRRASIPPLFHRSVRRIAGRLTADRLLGGAKWHSNPENRNEKRTLRDPKEPDSWYMSCRFESHIVVNPSGERAITAFVNHCGAYRAKIECSSYIEARLRV